jgi:hypothetical protein
MQETIRLPAPPKTPEGRRVTGHRLTVLVNGATLIQDQDVPLGSEDYPVEVEPPVDLEVRHSYLTKRGPGPEKVSRHRIEAPAFDLAPEEATFEDAPAEGEIAEDAPEGQASPRRGKGK